MVGQTYLLMIKCPKYDWLAAFFYKKLCYRRATAGTFVLDLLYSLKIYSILIYKYSLKRKEVDLQAV